MISFDRTPEDHTLMVEIVDRFAERCAQFNVVIDKLGVLMDLSATHANGNPLDLRKLAVADNTTLVHDAAGISWNLNRETGRLENCFVPRCSLKE